MLLINTNNIIEDNTSLNELAFDVKIANAELEAVFNDNICNEYIEEDFKETLGDIISKVIDFIKKIIKTVISLVGKALSFIIGIFSSSFKESLDNTIDNILSHINEETNLTEDMDYDTASEIDDACKNLLSKIHNKNYFKKELYNEISKKLINGELIERGILISPEKFIELSFKINKEQDSVYNETMKLLSQLYTKNNFEMLKNLADELDNTIKQAIAYTIKTLYKENTIEAKIDNTDLSALKAIQKCKFFYRGIEPAHLMIKVAALSSKDLSNFKNLLIVTKNKTISTNESIIKRIDNINNVLKKKEAFLVLSEFKKAVNTQYSFTIFTIEMLIKQISNYRKIRGAIVKLAKDTTQLYNKRKFNANKLENL